MDKFSVVNEIGCVGAGEGCGVDGMFCNIWATWTAKSARFGVFGSLDSGLDMVLMVFVFLWMNR